MADSFERILLSRLFKFKVGENETPITVHEQALANQSPALSVLMQGEMSESLAGEATWKDVDEGTFVRFTQFAYAGNYSVPAMFVKPSVKAPKAPEPYEEDWPVQGFGFSGKKKKSVELTRPKTFDTLSYSLLPSQANKFDLEVCEGLTENINEVILVHASLYVLAEKWGVESLKRLALFKQHQTLSKSPFVDLRKPNVCHVVKLARYVYSDENTPDLVNGIDELRGLISKYVAAHVKVMTMQPEFIEMIEEGGAFVRDVWNCVIPTLN